MQIEAIGSEFDCRVYGYEPLRAVYIADTDKGPMIIKEEARDADRILYIHGLKEYLHRNGFERLDRFVLTRNGLPFTVAEDGNRLFVMERFINGRECSFTNPFDRENAVKTLAELHIKGKGYMPLTGESERDNIGKWEKDYLKKIEYLLEIKQIVKDKRKKDFFDKMFMEDVDFMVDMGWRAYDTLKGADYKGVCEKARREKAICHHDYTYHNLIITGENEVNVIDFDYCCHELPVYDLAAYLMRILKRFDFDMEMALKLINEYHRINPISGDEMILMLSIFEFPQRFWRLTERYYRGKTDWSEKTFRHKYREVYELKDSLRSFTEDFRKYI